MKEVFSKFKLIISQEEIKSKIFQIAQKLDEEYNNKEITIIMILKGSFIFVSDLVREMKTPFNIEAISCSSYGSKGTKRGELSIQGLNELDIKSKHVLLIDDIFDSGNTTTAVMNEINKKNPASLKTLVLLFKKTSKKLKNIVLPDLFLFEVEDKFVVGYGLDYKEYFRGLKGIYSIE
ncbi:MAG: hypoxanthine phosphoribosyltransferase [Parachlamydiales bacterium]|jgi:hypoxanthine phosphoribosyltransferase